jgi:hypothetical protein
MEKGQQECRLLPTQVKGYTCARMDRPGHKECERYTEFHPITVIAIDIF